MHRLNFVTYLALASLALYARSAQAVISILTPASNTIWYKNNTVVTTWSAGPDDPTSFRIIVQQPDGNNATLADTVPTSLQALTLLLPQLANGGGYQIRYVNTTDINEIFAESQPFEIAQGAASATVSSTVAIPGPYTPFPTSATPAATDGTPSTRDNGGGDALLPLSGGMTLRGFVGLAVVMAWI
ncbi:hypothetical protein FFLO_07062 [Filobasidium floriforme]|uniref:Yeast cell wall synthesis Kre9/Knh1-like N-terminal domain-containing protein n=1 Tax=Filobasidium floriforme TaxID=5210 RepID=A0A8K0JJC8_9TREE|nr:uncharacterized protein HD553DRAFT_357518 [Filobasidium floriforme]KAG7527311.1 hypothetical protein FFLO_07062 [Filobasidium floriforme]KAH8083203.1 hypothetical protein HD553DRAFT_357518 [Filobasidium floriforme]